MEAPTEREDILYAMLQRVLHNHIVTNRLGYAETIAACVSVLGYVLYLMSETWEDAPALTERTVAALKQRLRALPTPPSLPPFAAAAPDTPPSPRYYDLGTALATFLTTAGIEYDMSVDATWRVMLFLLADVMAVPLHHGVRTSAEVDASIEALRDELPVVMQLWDEERERP
jgi:hypothetical protein